MLVVEYQTGEKDDNGYTIWHCRCDCGGEIDLSTRTLYRKGTISCGCTTKKDYLQREGVLAECMTGSICWDCIRSAAPEELQCKWVKSGCDEFPDGAVAILQGFVSGGKNTGNSLYRVKSCPEFLSQYNEENKKLLREARERSTRKNQKLYTASTEGVIMSSKSGLKGGLGL